VIEKEKANAAPTGSDFYTRAERRIEYLAVGVGALGTVVAFFAWGHKQAAGVAVGAAISCLNYRWMRLGVATMARISKAQAGSEVFKVPGGTYLRAIGRYALLVVGAYVMLHFFKLPVISLLAGFSAVLVGVLAEGILLLSGPGQSATNKP
jgi:hypothetical protein